MEWSRDHGATPTAVNEGGADTAVSGAAVSKPVYGETEFTSVLNLCVNMVKVV